MKIPGTMPSAITGEFRLIATCVILNPATGVRNEAVAELRHDAPDTEQGVIDMRRSLEQQARTHLLEHALKRNYWPVSFPRFRWQQNDNIQENSLTVWYDWHW